jgi:hypothetical protein
MSPLSDAAAYIVKVTALRGAALGARDADQAAPQCAFLRLLYTSMLNIVADSTTEEAIAWTFGLSD